MCYHMSLDFPLPVRSESFCFSFCLRGAVFCFVFFASCPEKGILDHIAHRPIIQAFTQQQLYDTPTQGLEKFPTVALSLRLFERSY